MRFDRAGLPFVGGAWLIALIAAVPRGNQRDQPSAADERQARPIETHHETNPQWARSRHARAALADLAVQVFLAMASHDVFHAIFELQLFLLEGDFFNLF